MLPIGRQIGERGGSREGGGLDRLDAASVWQSVLAYVVGVGVRHSCEQSARRVEIHTGVVARRTDDDVEPERPRAGDVAIEHVGTGAAERGDIEGARHLREPLVLEEGRRRQNHRRTAGFEATQALLQHRTAGKHGHGLAGQAL